jgi:hypothetical protein
MKVVPIPITWDSSLSIFSSEPFLRSVSPQYGWVGGLDNSGTLKCVLPYCLINKSIFRLIRFPVATIAIDGQLTIEEEHQFLNNAVKYFRGIGPDLIIPATFSTIFRTYPDGAATAPYGSCILSLDQSEESLWANLHQKHRNVIRSAGKKGVLVKSGMEHLETAYRLTTESFRRSAAGMIGKVRLGSRMDFGHFRREVDAFGSNVKVFVAEYEGIVQSAAVIPFSMYSAYYMHGGSIHNPVTGASNLLHWAAIREFCSLGVSRYDFFGVRANPHAGSKLEGIRKFKERFGGKVEIGYMWKMPFHRAKALLYEVATLIRSGGDVVHQERRTVRAA